MDHKNGRVWPRDFGRDFGQEGEDVAALPLRFASAWGTLSSSSSFSCPSMYQSKIQKHQSGGNISRSQYFRIFLRVLLVFARRGDEPSALRRPAAS